MKKLSLTLLVAIMMTSSMVFAGSIDYLTNQSAKFITTFTRNASTDASADIANYNPAGTVFLKEGLYLDLSNQFLFKPYKQDYTLTTMNYPPSIVQSTRGTSVEQSEPTLLLPNLYAVYNFGEMGPGKLAAYCHLGISAGGGTLKWDDGTIGTQLLLSTVVGSSPASQSFEVYSVYYTAHVGAAYEVLKDMVSVSLGGKIIMPDRYLKLEGVNAAGNRNINGKFEYKATGYTGVIGVDVKPISDLTIGLRYELETKLKFKYEEAELAGDSLSVTIARGILSNIHIKDGEKFNYNLPAMFAFGAEYKVMPELTVMAACNIYFLSQADLGVSYKADLTFKQDTNKYFGTGWEASVGATYQVMPELKVGAGFMYNKIGVKDDYFSTTTTMLNCSANPPLDSYTIGLGGTYTVMEGFDITLAGSWTHYLPKSYDLGAVATDGSTFVMYAEGEYKKDVYNIALGVGYKAF